MNKNSYKLQFDDLESTYHKKIKLDKNYEGKEIERSL
jgi:hypothetical protein